MFSVFSADDIMNAVIQAMVIPDASRDIPQ
jgi:hypothetical protein